MKTFEELKINDLCYSVELRGIQEHLVRMIDCTGRNTKVRITRTYYEDDNFIVEDNPSIAIAKDKYSKPVIYADIQLAKEKLYEIRSKHMAMLHSKMVSAINEYEEANKMLRAYSDMNVPEDIKL